MSATFGRRSFFALASGLFVPWEPERVYSFLPAWRLVNRDTFDDVFSHLDLVETDGEQVPGKVYTGSPSADAIDPALRYFAELPEALYERRSSIWGNNAAVIHPSNLLDVQKSAEAYGIPLRFASHRDERDGGRA